MKTNERQVMVCVSTARTLVVTGFGGTAQLTCTQLTLTIKKDLKLTQTDISNSNIIALVAT